MCHRLARRATAMAEEGALYLRIHPEKEALMRETFGKRFTLIIELVSLPIRLNFPQHDMPLNFHFLVISTRY